MALRARLPNGNAVAGVHMQRRREGVRCENIPKEQALAPQFAQLEVSYASLATACVRAGSHRIVSRGYLDYTVLMDSRTVLY